MLRTLVAFWASLIVATAAASADERRFRVSELVPVGFQIGFVDEPPPVAADHPIYYVVFPKADSAAEKLITVNERTGEVVVSGPLDHEGERELLALVIPIDGSPSRRLVVEVEDENDNSPTFPVPSAQLDISEYARLDSELPLPFAKDPDSEPFNVQKYRIARGNVNNVFRLSSRPLNGQLYVDLVVNGQLDREYRDHYDLLIEALDGGDPPRMGKLDVHIRVLDANDNAPVFAESRYSAHIAPNVTDGTPVITVAATDADEGENSRLSYRLVQANHDESFYFQIDDNTGLISVGSAQPPAGSVHELLVTAIDHGIPQPLESTVFLTVSVLDEDSTANAVGLSLIWLTDNGEPIVHENLTVGFVVARVSINEENGPNVKLSINSSTSLCLKQTDSVFVYLLMVCGPLDREAESHIRLVFTLSNNAQTIIEHPVHLDVGDVNDNPPRFAEPVFRFVFAPGLDAVQQSSLRLLATDADSGENAQIRYSIHGTNLFAVNTETGLLSAISPLNCSVGPEVRFRAVAEDSGTPALSATVDVIVDIVDANAEPPIFEKNLYEVNVREDAEPNACLLKVKAIERGCGSAIRSVHYSLRDADPTFRIDADGKLCLAAPLDFEKRHRFQLTVLANGQGDRTATALVNINVEDVNDNIPLMEPNEYHLALRIGDEPSSEPLLYIAAFDGDQGPYGEVRYALLSDSLSSGFRLDSKTGALYLEKPLTSFVSDGNNRKGIELKVEAKDGGGLTSQTATIYIDAIPRDSQCVAFTNTPLEFRTAEDILPGIILGTVRTLPPRSRLELIGGDADEHFQLDSKSGRLTVAKELDADRRNLYLLNIKATNEESNCSNYTQIRVHVEDMNDNAPEFDMAAVETNIYEDFPIHEPFFAVHATDRDRDENGRVTYELVGSDPPCPVIVRPLTGELLLAAPLDFESVQRYRVRIKAQDQGIPPRAATINLTLNVFDVNDNSPEFERPLFTAEVSEEIPLMTEVLRVVASDRDAAENAHLRFRFESPISDFGINPKSGQIFVRRELDRERQPEYSFLVVAADNGQPQRSANASVHIRVLDVNDNTPNCSTIQKLTFKEESESRQWIGQLNAVDLDAGPNGTVNYRLQKHHDLFDVKPNGDVHLRRRIPNARDFYRLSVIASDEGQPPRAAVCQIIIKSEKSPSDVGILEPIERNLVVDPAAGLGFPLVRINATNAVRWAIDGNERISPLFDVRDGVVHLVKSFDSVPADFFRRAEPLTVNIFDALEQKKQITFAVRKMHKSISNSTMDLRLSERTAAGARLSAVATDAAEDVFFTLEDSDDLFELDSRTGILYLAGHLNFSASPFHSLRIIKHHRSSLNETSVTVTVDDENVNSPVFDSALFRFSVPENTLVGSVVAQLEAYDPDEGPNGTLSYRIVGENPFFSIDPLTAEILLRAPLNFRQNPKIHFVVEATDSAQIPTDRRSTQSSVLIEVVDINDNSPQFVSQPNVTISTERLPHAEPIHYFVATDDDDGLFGTVTYSIVNGNNPPMFSLDSHSGALTILNRPAGVVQLTVRASDSDPIQPKMTEQIFTVFVQPGESKWIYFSQPLYHFTLTPNTAAGTLLVDLKRPSFETTARPRFTLLPRSLNDFELDAENGILKTKADTLMPGIHRFIVHATDDRRKESDTATVVVNIPPAETAAPKIVPISCGNVTLRENQTIAKVARVVATVGGAISTSVRYQIEGGTGGELFRMDSATGVISAKPLDREAIAEHILVVSASDNNVPRRVDICTIKVKLIDENDNSPQFTDESTSAIEILPKTPIGAIVGRLEATDPDEGPNGRVVYRLATDSSGMLDIDPDSGEIFFARELPFSGFGWEITVVAEDSGPTRVQSTERKIPVIYKRPTISTKPRLQFLHKRQTVVVAEGLPRGKFVLQLESTDRFFPTTSVAYAIVNGNIDSAFEIDEMGVLKTAMELDAEIRSLYNLRIQTTGPFDGPPAETLITVRVLDLNDNPPVLSQTLRRRVDEILPIGSALIAANAHDADRHSFVEYSLKPPNEHFELNRFSGELYLAKPLDHEAQSVHVLAVHAFDGEHTTNANITIEVADVNDNSPVFTNDLFEFTVLPTTRPLAEIGQITALDADSGAFGRLKYSLAEVSDLIKVNGTTGIVTLMKKLSENEEKFVSVQVSDGGSPPLRGYSTIKLSAVPKSVREVPLFTKDTFSFLVSEDFPPHLPFGTLNVRNGGPFARFSFDQSNATAVFRIDESGRLSLRQPLDYEIQTEYRFKITVKNVFAVASRLHPSSSASVHIKVGDVNDNEPKFAETMTALSLRVDENTKRGSRLGSLLASDADSAENSKLLYSVVSGNEWETIRVDAASGAIFFERWTDELLTEWNGEASVQRKLVFRVEDGGDPVRFALLETQLEIGADEWSGSAPFFPLPAYERFISEGTQNGTQLLRAKATNRCGVAADQWKYSIFNNDEVRFFPNNPILQIFVINEKTGEISLNGELDYEKHIHYEFDVTVSDHRDRSAVAPVRISVVGVDEFAPVFAKPSYTFQVPWTAKIGQQIGRVVATDEDAGTDGKVEYLLPEQNSHSLISVNPETGALILRQQPDRSANQTDRFAVIASSGPQQFTRVNIILEFSDSATLFVDEVSAPTMANRFTAAILAAFALLLCLFMFLLCSLYTRGRNGRKRPRKQIYSVARGNVAVMADVQRLSPTFPKAAYPSPPTIPPSYSKPCSVVSTSSEERTQSGVRMRDDALGSRSQPDSGIDPDVISVGSGITEYLNQMSARSALNGSSVSDPVISEILNASVESSIPQSSRVDPTIPIVHSITAVRPMSLKRQLQFDVPAEPTFADALAELRRVSKPKIIHPNNP